MRINLNKIRRDVPVAVHIPTFEDGRAFLEEMRRQYPDSVKAWNRPYYETYRLEIGGNFYYPRLNLDKPRMTHGDRETYIDMGVLLIEFEDVCEPDIELETALSDKPLESLFE